jgi:hypothetical protein
MSLPSNAGRDYSSVRAMYLRFGTALRRLTWTAAGALLEPPIYTFVAGPRPNGEPGWEGDRDAMYFVDGNTLLKLPSGGAPTAMTTLGGTSIGLLQLTDDRIVIQQADRSANQVLAISSIAKSGGPVTTLAGSGAVAIGTTSNGVLYSQGATWHLARADGSNDSVVAGSGIVYQRARLADHQYIESLTTCQPDVTSDTSCSNGNFVQTSLTTGLPILLGHISHTTTYSGTFLIGYGDVATTTTGVPEPLKFHISSDAAGHLVNTSDLYIGTPGNGGSLARVSNNIP